jgi:EAL domain-containing protein (putative c-di-GMP-specific phosphodiesterase class I)
MWDRAVQRLNIEAQIRRGIANDEFRLLYQPIVDLVDHGVVGFEALVRWSHPERGLLGPGSFIALAEETGLIVDLGEWVLQEAARTVAAWDLPSTRELSLSVNVSSRQLSSAGLLASVAAARAAIWPTALCLELTESTLMDDTVTVRDMIERLTSAGTSLSIDDFGTGYSSLSYLTRLPVTTLKIDQSFVSALGVIAQAQTVAAAILSLATQLGLKVIAEGVETADQERLLVALGCRTAQGFLFHRPLVGEEARALLGHPEIGLQVTNQ